MPNETEVLEAERKFFDALVAGDVKTLERVLSDDFIIIDVMGGSEASKPMILGAIGAGWLKFETIKPVEARVRFYSETAVVTGRTQMQGQLEGAPFEFKSRYTHVYAKQESQWRLVSAQGTQIARE